MGIFRGSTPQILQDLGAAGIEYQVTLTLTPEQIRSLNTLPVNIVVPANANTLLVPLWWLLISPGLTGYGADVVTPQLAWSPDPGTHNLLGTALDDIPDAGTLYLQGVDVGAQINPTDFINTAAVGATLTFQSGGDTVATGTGGVVIILTYVSYDLTGLL